ncbi:MAG TPA: murein biosynthesis integral membrane protein MurJ [Chlamydiales bacterium]|nr:murein biosynthesis integral membrane protein MurJ [Chlamydiales bacterium]
MSELVVSARKFFSGTLLSRISGMLRDMALAFFFGSSPVIASFMIAYRFANLLRRLLGEGSLQAGFIPHFAGLKASRPKEAETFFRDGFFTLFIVLAGVVLVGEGALSLLKPSNDFAEVFRLTKIMLPGLIFICLYAFSAGHLQCERKFFLPAVTPALFNLLWILVAFIAYKTNLFSIGTTLSIGVLAAFLLQWGVTMAASVKELTLSFKEWLQFKLFPSEIKKLFKPLSLSVIGVAAMQMNAALDSIFAKFADPSGPAYLWYAIRVEQLPLALFGIALANALLPTLSRLVHAGDFENYQKQLRFAISGAIVFMLAASGGLFALGGSGLNLLYGRGHFTSSTLIETLFCLWGYAGSLLPGAMVLFLANGYYAQKQYALPAIASVISVLFHILLNGLFIFVFSWGAFSIALSTTLSSLLNCVILGYLLSKKYPKIFSKKIFLKTATMVVASAFLTIEIGHLIGNDGTFNLLLGKEGVFATGFSNQLVSFVLLAFVYLGSFFAFAKIFRIEELFIFLRKKSFFS